MALIKRAHAVNDLQGLFDDIADIVKTAVIIYHQSYPPKLVKAHESRTKASIIRDHMIEEARKRFDKYGDAVREHEAKGGLTLFVVYGKYLLRFKKLDEDKKTKNQPTAQVAKFKRQESLPGLEPLVNVEAGYVLNEFEPNKSEVWIACPNGEKQKPYWTIDLDDPKKGIDNSNSIFPDDDVDDVQSGTAVKPKTRPGIVVPFKKEGTNEDKSE